jgi:ankyrin repeat protein
MEQKKVPPPQQLEVIELLLRFHVDPDGTPDHLPLGMVRDGRAAILLVRAGADPNKKYSSGETLLMRMAASGNLDVVRVLLAAGADASATIARIGAGAVRIQQSAENIADAAGQKAIVRLLRDFPQNGKASLVWSPDTATSGEASATQSSASFTPTGQTPPLLRGFSPSNSP